MDTNTTTPQAWIEKAWRDAANAPPPPDLGIVSRFDASAPRVRLPFYGCSIPAGFPSPADDHLRQVLSLDEHCIRRPAATFLAEVTGDSMRDANIHAGDVVVIDRSITPSHGKIVVAVLDGGHTIKRLWMKNGRVFLVPSNRAFQPIEITEGQELQIWGVVAWILHNGQAA
ncbi:LexA family protein [Chitinimonas naiadis]